MLGRAFSLQDLPQNYSYGQPVWCGNSEICLIAWKKSPIHESMDACFTLPSLLLFYDTTLHRAESVELEVVSVLSIRCSATLNSFAIMQRSTNWSHSDLIEMSFRTTLRCRSLLLMSPPEHGEYWLTIKKLRTPTDLQVFSCLRSLTILFLLMEHIH